MRRLTAYNLFMETIYIDRLFVLNFIIDYLILIGSARICGIYMRRVRYALSAAFGAAYAVLYVLPDLSVLSAFPLKLLSGILMSLIAFCGEKKLLRCTLVFFAVSALFGGAIWALSMQNDGALYLPLSFPTLLFAFLAIYAVLSLIFRGSAKAAAKRLSRITLQHRSKEVSFSALHDSGNSLFDPISGAGVVIVSPEIGTSFFGEVDWGDPAEAAIKCDGMRLVPYSAVGTQSGLMAAFKPESIELDGKKRDDLIVAISPVEINGDGYTAVTQEEK